MEALELREIINQDWRTDDFIRKQLLCNKLKYCNDLQRRFRLDYNINDYDGIAEEKYIKNEKGDIITLNTYLSKHAELVDLSQMECEINFDIDLSKEKIVGHLIYYFHRDANTIELRKKKAIILETFSYEDFRNIVKYVGYDDFENYEEYRQYFTKIFKFYFLKANDQHEIKFLYTHTPEYILRAMNLDNEMIFGHLLDMVELDDNGFFSGWRDGSSALINILKAFSDQKFLVDKFRTQPELCNRIYFNLEGASELNGEIKSNRIVFANILMQYCLFSPYRPTEGAPTFRMGNGYIVNTDVMDLSGSVFGFGQSDEKTFFLQQQKEVVKRVAITPKEGDPNATELTAGDLDQGAQYLPMEMIYFINENKTETENEETGQDIGTIVMKVPAIYVKALADAKEWEDINDNIRIAADMIGIVLGIGTLTLSGNPYVLLAAAADLSLAVPDLTIQVFREEIAKLDGGNEFLRQWDLIYNTGGAIVAAPQIVVGFYRTLLSLMKFPQTAEKVRQGLRAMAISVFLDLNSGRFRRSQLRLFEPTEWVIPSAGFFSKTSECDVLVQNGAFFMELDAAAIIENVNKGVNPDVIGAISPNRKFALVYKGEIIAQGSRYDKAYQETLMRLKQASYDAQKVKAFLEVKLLLKNKESLNLLHGTSPNAANSIKKNGVLLSMNLIELDFNTKGKGAFYTSSSYKETVGYNKYKFDSRGLPSDIVQFDIPEKELLKLNIKVFDIPSKEWADFVTKARTGRIVHEHDIVIGPKLKNPWDVIEGIALPKAHKEFQIAITSEKGAKVMTKYLRK